MSESVLNDPIFFPSNFYGETFMSHFPDAQKRIEASTSMPYETGDDLDIETSSGFEPTSSTPKISYPLSRSTSDSHSSLRRKLSSIFTVPRSRSFKSRVRNVNDGTSESKSVFYVKELNLDSSIIENLDSTRCSEEVPDPNLSSSNDQMSRNKQQNHKSNLNKSCQITPKQRMLKKTPKKCSQIITRFSNAAGGVKRTLLKDLKSHQIFGVSLQKLCQSTGELPPPIMELFYELKKNGPKSHGIFRKPANARLVREWKTKLNSGVKQINVQQVNIYQYAALLKEFLRSLPECILTSKLYKDWLSLAAIKCEKEKFVACQKIISKLPELNLKVVKYILCILRCINAESDSNQMSFQNLAICISQSLLYDAKITDFAMESIPVVTYLIENCLELFGNDVITALDQPTSDPMEIRHYKASYKLSLESRTSLDSGLGSASSLPSSGRFSTFDPTESDLFSRRRNISAVTLKSQDSGLDIEESFSESGESPFSVTGEFRPFSPKVNFRTKEPTSQSHFQRNEWMRRRSVIRKVPKVPPHRKTLVRASSEESILNKIINNEQPLDHVMNQLADFSFDKKLSSTNVSKDSGLTLSWDEDEPDFKNLKSKKIPMSNFSVTDEPLIPRAELDPVTEQPIKDEHDVIAKSNFQRKSWMRNRSRPKMYYRNLNV